jgi:hypothetical protein
MGGWRRSKIHILILQGLPVTTCSPKPHSRLVSVKTWGLVVSLASRGYTTGHIAQQVANAQTCLRRTASIGLKEPPRMSVNSFRRSGSAITSVCGTQTKRSATAILAGVQRGSDTFYFSSYRPQAGDRSAICRVLTRKRIRGTRWSASERHRRSSLFCYHVYIPSPHCPRALTSPAISTMHAPCAEQCLTKSQVSSPRLSP